MKFVKSQLTAIITIYRNDKDDSRRLQKNKFLEEIKKLKKYGNFDIFIIEQSEDGYKFNIGKLKNIGFNLAKKSGKKYDFYVFTDIDIIPDKELSNYYFQIIDGIGCFGIRGTRYFNKGNPNCFTGTSIGVNKESFEKINGYPNNFWGWGGEDTIIHGRSNLNDVKMYYPIKGKIIDLEQSKDDKKITAYQKNVYLNENNLKENVKIEKIILDRKIWRNNGINNINYDILKKSKKKSSFYNLYHFIVDLKYESDKIKFKDWYDISKYKKIKHDDLKIIYKKVKKKYYNCTFKYY